MNPQTFREYDIRGDAEVDLTPDAIKALGLALGTYFLSRHCRTVSLGRDVRLSSDRLRENLLEGLLRTGVCVTDVGRCTTPALYFATRHLESDGGVMITGSHNPPRYNGFKVVVGISTIHGEEIRDIHRLLCKGDFAAGDGQLIQKEILPDYKKELVSRLGPLDRPLRLVVDCGNGAASLVAMDVYARLGCEVLPLFCEADGRFPNHHPDPTVEANLQDLVKTVVRKQADLGVAFDGDGDRLGAVDQSGEIIWGDELMILFTRSIMEAGHRGPFIAEVKCSKRLFDDVEKRGGRIIMWKAGHSLIKAKMAEERAVFGGEWSGHMCFADRYYGFDDGVYAAGRLLEICAASKVGIGEQLADLPPSYRTPELRIECSEEHKFEIVHRVQKHFTEGGYEAITIDGIRVLFRDGWGLIRASNTQPELVLRFEADSKERLVEIRSLIEEELFKIMGDECSGV